MRVHGLLNEPGEPGDHRVEPCGVERSEDGVEHSQCSTRRNIIRSDLSDDTSDAEYVAAARCLCCWSMAAILPPLGAALPEGPCDADGAWLTALFMA